MGESGGEGVMGRESDGGEWWRGSGGGESGGEGVVEMEC